MRRLLHGLLIILPVWTAILALSLPAKSTDTAQPATSTVMIGDVAPDFALQDENGQVVHLTDYRNKKRVILFFFAGKQASDCADLCCAFKKCYKKYKEQDGEILAISPDSVNDNKALKEENKLPYPILSDPGNKVRKLWHVPIKDNKSCRTTYIIDKRGRVKKIITSEGTPVEYMKDVDAGWESTWFIGG